MVTYVELPLPRDAQPGYQVSATDLCLFAAKRRSVYLSAASRPSSPSGAITDPASVQSASASTDITTTQGSPPAANAGAPVIHASLGGNEKPGTYALLLPVQDSNVPGAPSRMLTSAEPRSSSPAASIAALTLAGQRQNVLPPGVFPTQQLTSVSRPRSMASIPTAPRTSAPTTNIYATTERRRNPNRQNTLARSIHRRSLQSPVELLDDRMTSRTPLIAQQSHVMTPRAPQTAARIPIVTSRSSLIRIPTESAV